MRFLSKIRYYSHTLENTIEPNQYRRQQEYIQLSNNK